MNTGMHTMGGGATMPTRFAEGDILGSWRIESQLGQGGMSTVYAVVHTEIGKRAALKIVHGHVLSSKFTAERVLLEAQVVNRIAHDGIVDIFESGMLPDGRPYLVMERLEGRSLYDRCDAEPIDAEEVIEILLQACGAVGAAHAAGVVHCDLKPDNVFLISEAPVRAKILDWGIAQVVSTSLPNSGEGMIVGTPQYLAPEQASGGEVTPATDIYSLGVIAYELFLHALPFEAETNEALLMMHVNNAPPLPREKWTDIPVNLETLLLAMLAKTPDARPTVVEVVRVLANVRGDIRRAGRAPETLSERARSLVRTELVAPILQARTRRYRTGFAMVALASLLAGFTAIELGRPDLVPVASAAPRMVVAPVVVPPPPIVPPPASPSKRVEVNVSKIAIAPIAPARRKVAYPSAPPPVWTPSIVLPEPDPTPPSAPVAEPVPVPARDALFIDGTLEAYR
jgi:eukaryotic-like serine/threonine-protein kinase